MGEGHQEDNAIRGWGLRISQTSSYKKGEPEIEFGHVTQWFNQSCLCDETPVKTLNTGAQFSFLINERYDELRG